LLSDNISYIIKLGKGEKDEQTRFY